MPTSKLPVIDAFGQDPSTGHIFVASSVALHARSFTNGSDTALTPDPIATCDINGIASNISVPVAAGTSVRVRGIYQGMANYLETQSG